jgi:hypothetical protein
MVCDTFNSNIEENKELPKYKIMFVSSNSPMYLQEEPRIRCYEFKSEWELLDKKSEKN